MFSSNVQSDLITNITDLAGFKGFSSFINMTAGVLIYGGPCLGVVTAVTVTDSVLQSVVIHHRRVGCLRLSLGVLGAGIGVGGCWGFSH